jgi:aminopeptidase N
MSTSVTEAPPTSAPVEKFRKDYKKLPWVVGSISMLFDLVDGATDEERATTVTAQLEISPADDQTSGHDLVMDCEGIDVKMVSLNGVAVTAFNLADDKLTIPSAVLPRAGPFVLETVSAISPAANLQLSGLYKSTGMFCTQCEAEGFRRITPYFDRPDVMTAFKVRIEADRAAYPILLSNGNKVAEGDVAGRPGRHFAEWVDPFKKPSYLFALVAGDLGSVKSTFKTSSGRDVALEIFSEHANVDQLDHAMASVHKAMKWDEER